LPIRVLADNQTKMQGMSDPALTYTAERQSTGRGLVNGERLSGALIREGGNGLGDYVISQGSLTDANNSNYEITFVDGKFTIRPASEVNTAQMAAQSMAGNSAQSFAPFTQTQTSGNNSPVNDPSGNLGQSSGLKLVEVGDQNGPGDSSSESGTSGGSDVTPGSGGFNIASSSSNGPLTVFVIKGGIKLPNHGEEQTGQE